MELTASAPRAASAPRTASAPGVVDRPDRRRRWTTGGPRRIQVAARPGREHTRIEDGAREVGDLWERSGASAYALACALLGNEEAATEAVRLAMADLDHADRGPSAEEARLALSRRVYRRAQELAIEAPDSARLPAAVVWVSKRAWLQRASIALCVFGGLTYRQAAELLDVRPRTVADLLTAGLRELGSHAATRTVSCA